MAKRNYTDADMGEILNSLEGIQKAFPEPFLFTRIQGRMMQTEDSSWSKVLQFVSKPAFALATVILFLIINGYILLNHYKESDIPKTDSAQTLALEYASLTSPLYDNIDENP